MMSLLCLRQGLTMFLILGCFNSRWSLDWLWTLGPSASACPLLRLEVNVTMPSQMSIPTRTALRFLQLNLMSVMTEWHRWASKSLLQLLLLKGQMKTKRRTDKVSQSSEFLHSTLPPFKNVSADSENVVSQASYFPHWTQFSFHTSIYVSVFPRSLQWLSSRYSIWTKPKLCCTNFGNIQSINHRCLTRSCKHLKIPWEHTQTEKNTYTEHTHRRTNAQNTRTEHMHRLTCAHKNTDTEHKHRRTYTQKNKCTEHTHRRTQAQNTHTEEHMHRRTCTHKNTDTEHEHKRTYMQKNKCTEHMHRRTQAQNMHTEEHSHRRIQAEEHTQKNTRREKLSGPSNETKEKFRSLCVLLSSVPLKRAPSLLQSRGRSRQTQLKQK